MVVGYWGCFQFISLIIIYLIGKGSVIIRTRDVDTRLFFRFVCSPRNATQPLVHDRLLTYICIYTYNIRICIYRIYIICFQRFLLLFFLFVTTIYIWRVERLAGGTNRTERFRFAFTRNVSRAFKKIIYVPYSRPLTR